MSKKIVILAHSHTIHGQRWIKYFIRTGWEVYIISFHPYKIEGAHNIYINVGEISLKGGNYKYLLKLFKIVKLIYRIKPDIVNSQYLVSFGFIGYFTFYKPHVISLMGSDVFLFSCKNMLYKILSKKTLSSAKLIISVSETMTSFIMDKFKINSNKIITRQYGIDTNLFKIKKSLNERHFEFITNRSFYENSNYDIIIKCISGVIKKIPEVKLVIVGEGVLKDHIAKMIKDHGISSNVILKDKVEHHELVDLLNSSKIYLSLPSSDGTPLSVFEAIACGTYPILSDIPANREWVTKGMIGKCVNLNDVNSIAEVMAEIYQNIDHLSFQSENGTFVKRFMDYQSNMKYIEKKINNLIE